MYSEVIPRSFILCFIVLLFGIFSMAVLFAPVIGKVITYLNIYMYKTVFFIFGQRRVCAFGCGLGLEPYMYL